MAFNWLILKLDCKPYEDGLEKVISTIHYRVQKEENGTLAEYDGAMGTLAPDPISFTPYDEVTKEIVEKWLETNLDCEKIEEKLNNKIQAFLNPPIMNYPLPWDETDIIETAAPIEQAVIIEEPIVE